jgi:hypothetical protein
MQFHTLFLFEGRCGMLAVCRIAGIKLAKILLDSG